MKSLRLQSIAALALIALLPVAAFTLDRSDFAVVLSLVSVVIIAGSLYLMFSPAEERAGDQPA